MSLVKRTALLPIWPLILALAAAGATGDSSAAPALSQADRRTINFVRDIQPILKASCYECHGPSKQKGKLRLDSKPSALRGGKSGKAIIAGDSAKSTLAQRLQNPDEDERMPQGHDPLPKEQIATIRLW